MIVVIPTNTNHIIRFIPRFYPDNLTTFTIRNEFTDASNVIGHTYKIKNGYLFLTFDFSTFEERDRFQITVSEGSRIVYRGIMFATSQTTQEFKLSEGVYL